VSPVMQGHEGTLRRVKSGEAVMNEGDSATWFGDVIEGTAQAQRRTPTGQTVLGEIHPGSIIGELALITGSPRTASVVATSDMVIKVHDAADFASLLEDQEFAESLAEHVADRLAALAPPVPVALRNGATVVLRPGLASDRPALEAGLAAMSRESLRKRFFSGGFPPESVISRLVTLDYFNHFAWVVSEGPDPDGELVGSASYFRSTERLDEADISFGIIDRAQNQGIGRVLAEAIGVACAAAGITTLTADVLRENTPMRALLRRPSTEWTSPEPGVVHATMQTAEFGNTLLPAERDALAAVASSIIWHTAALLIGRRGKGLVSD
jgi:protein lysine acetyltransferase